MDINKKLQDVLSGLDMGKLNSKNVGAILNSPEAQKLKQQLNDVDKQKILDTFSNMNTNEMKSKLSKADLNNISKMSAEDIINKLKNL